MKVLIILAIVFLGSCGAGTVSQPINNSAVANSQPGSGPTTATATVHAGPNTAKGGNPTTDVSPVTNLSPSGR